MLVDQLRDVESFVWHHNMVLASSIPWCSSSSILNCSFKYDAV
jgi:hypothetical protein